MATFKSDSYEGRYLQLDITEEIDAIANTSKLTWKLTSTGGATTYYTIGATTVVINGETVYSKGRTNWNTYEFPAKTGSKSGSLTVKHDSDGKKKIAVSFKTRVYVWEPLEYGGEMTLTTIDRAAPTVSISASNITSSGFKISATASTKCDVWDYSLDNGSTWTNFSKTNGTSASVSVTGLSVNTSYNVKVRARRTYNQVYGTSSKKDVKTLGFTLFNSCAAFYADASTAQIKPNVTVYDADFTHVVKVLNGSTQVFKIEAISWGAGTATKTLSLTTAQKNALQDCMTTVKSKDFTVTIETYDGSSLVGSVSRTVTANTSAANSAPTFDGFTYLDSSAHAALTGNDQVLIQDYSTLSVTATAATAKNRAKISSYTAKIADKTVKSSTTAIAVGNVGSSGTLELTVTATDSRGWSTSVTKKVKVLEYDKPQIDSITLRRANGIDKTIQLSVSGSVTSLKPNGSTEVNAIESVSFRYKSTGDPTYSDANAVSLTSRVEFADDKLSFSFETNELMSLDDEKSFDFRFYVSDGVTYEHFYYVLPKGIPLVALRKNKVGINNPNPEYTLDVAGDINLTGEIYINGKKLSEVLGL